MMEIKKPDKKSLQYLGIIIIIAIVVCIGLFYYFSKSSVPETTVNEEVFKELRRQKIVNQLKELESSKEEIPPLPSEEIQKQLKELNKSL